MALSDLLNRSVHRMQMVSFTIYITKMISQLTLSNNQLPFIPNGIMVHPCMSVLRVSAYFALWKN